MTEESAGHGPASFAVVGVGASAGGLNAFTRLLGHLPSDTGMAFVLVSHLSPHHASALTELLGSHTTMPVVEAMHGATVAPNHVYVIAPNTDLELRQGQLLVKPREGGTHLPVDCFFRSLASEWKTQAIGVVLSGTASDGTAGLQAIKSEGGITFVQDASAQFESMPRNAQAAGGVDFVLPPEKIAEELARIARHSCLSGTPVEAVVQNGPALQRVLGMLRDALGVDFAYYKLPTVQRRVLRRMVLRQTETLEDYLKLLESTPGEMQCLFDDLLISVTHFFRDAGAFEALQQKGLPELLQGRRRDLPIRVWVPGCATGEEVYSIAISILEYLAQAGQNFPIQIFGTDLSEQAIAVARQGRYPETIAETVSGARLTRFFVRTESGYQVSRGVRQCCVFSRQDLTRDPPLARMDLISCRNVLIYLGSVLQKRVISTFSYALQPHGCLLLGNSETVAAFPEHFVPLDAEHRLYGRNPQHAYVPVDAVPSLRTGKGAAAALDAPNLEAEADRLLMAEYAPSGMIVNAHGQIVSFRGDVGPYISPVSGGATLEVLKLVREDLAGHVRSALAEAAARQNTARRDGLLIFHRNARRAVNLIVRPVSLQSAEQYFLVLFEEPEHAPRAAVPLGAEDGDAERPADSEQLLEQELAATRGYLQSLIEDLRSANEEAQSSNEELQSTNEELLTAKEELQSSNEELSTMNDEMRARNSELNEVNNDLLNLLSSMQTPIVMLNNDLRIRRFTPSSQKVLNLIPGDVGRPISDLKPRINVPDLEERLLQVIESLEPYEQEVRDQEGRWHSLRIRPYRTADNHIAGAVVQLLDIDQIRKSLAQVEETRNYAEAILATIREPLLVLDHENCLLSANRSFFETFHLKPEQSLGRSFFELQRGRWDLPRVRHLLEQTGGDLRDVEVDQAAEGEGTRVYRLNARHLVRQGANGQTLLAIEDITGLKRMAEAKYRRLFESAKDGILLVHAVSGDIEDVNPYLMELLGYRREDLVGKCFWTTAPFDDIPDAATLMERVKGETLVRVLDVTLKTRDARQVSVEIVANCYREMENEVCQLNIRDITERKHFEEQMQQRAKLESLGLLAGGVAHDFNNLLTGIMGNASLALNEGGADAYTQQLLKEVVLASQRAADLTRQMLAYAGKGRFIVERVNISDLTREISTLVRTSIPKNVEVKLNLADDLPPVVADGAQIQQLIMNLVINGAEAIPDGHNGYVRVTTGTQQADAEMVRTTFGQNAVRPGLYVTVEVTDSGAGMDEATKSKIFDPFFTTKFTGRGLGLAAASGIVRGHRGAIRVFSTPGLGTTFKVWLPAAAHGPKKPKEKRAPNLHGSSTILVVDDEEMVLRMATKALEKYGYQTLIAPNGECAVEMVKENNSIDAVILDLAMPVMNGDEALALLKAVRPELPVIVSSGHDEAEAMRRFPGKDVAAFVQKPYTVEKLLEILKATLK